MRRRFRKTLKECVPEEEMKCVLNEVNRVNRLHRYMFSKSKMFLLFFARITGFTLSFFLPLVFFFAVSFVIALVMTQIQTPNEIGEASNILYGIAWSAFSALILSIIITSLLQIKSEYFGKKENLMFITSNTIGMPNYLYIVDILIALAFLISAKISESKKDIVSLSLTIIIYSVVLVLYFVLFQTKNKIEKYFYYLKSRKELRSFTRDRAMKDFMLIVKNNDKENYDAFDTVVRITKGELYALHIMFDDLSKKIEEGEDTTKEQNIIEEYIEKLYSKAISPNQQLSVIVMTNIYYERFLKLLTKHDKVKDYELSSIRLIKIFASKENKKARSIRNFRIEKDKLKFLILLIDKFKKTGYQLKDIVFIQMFYQLTKQFGVKVLSDLSSLVKDKNKKQQAKKYLDLYKTDQIQSEELASKNNEYLANLLSASCEFYTKLDERLSENNEAK